MLKTIVVGVDGREGGRDALALAGRLALLAGGELVAVRALPFDNYVGRGGGPQYNSLADAEAQRQVEQDLAEAGLTARTRLVADASPARALHRMAEALDADVIVVGSTRRGAVGGVFAGDDAAATLHASSCAVAVAPRGLADEEWTPVNRIGVGLNASAEAHQALALAVALAADCGASLVVRTVVAASIADADLTAYDADWLERSKAVAKQELDEAVERPGGRGLGRRGGRHRGGRARRALPHGRPACRRLTGVGPGAAHGHRQHRREADVQGALPGARAAARRGDRPARRKRPRGRREPKPTIAT